MTVPHGTKQECAMGPIGPIIISFILFYSTSYIEQKQKAPNSKDYWAAKVNQTQLISDTVSKATVWISL